jgi:hypothetical protein
MTRRMMTGLMVAAAAAQLTTATPLAQQPETISIRGHWVLQVRDREGAVVTRREFDNDLNPFAALIFQAVFGRQGTLGRYGVSLRTAGNDPAGGQPYVNPFGAVPGVDIFGSVTAATHTIDEPTATVTVEDVSNELPFSGVRVAVAGATATVAGFITGVGTRVTVCADTTTPAVCKTGQNIQSTLPFTYTNVAPLRLEQGQMLDVTVVISFGSAPHPPSFQDRH